MNSKYVTKDLLIKSKYTIKVPHSEKEIYRGCRELTRFGRTQFTYPKRDKRNSISRKFSVVSKDVPKPDFIIPPANLRDSRQIRIPMSVVQLPIDKTLKERKGRHYSYFDFYRIRNTL